MPAFTRFRRAGIGLALTALASISLPAPLIAQPAAPAAPAAQGPATGSANINITPRRVIFDAVKRTEAVYVFNQGNTAVTVEVSLIDNVMLPTGEIVPLAKVAEKGPAAVATAALVKSAKPLILATPSRLTLSPGQGKTIRLRATPPDGAPAEYRTHLTVTTVPPADSGLTADQAAAVQRGELVLRIQSIFGLSIPLIVRSGGVGSSATFGAIRAVTEGPDQFIEVPIRRAGSASVYGNVEVRAGKSEVVGLIRGLGIYPEITERTARIPLNRSLRKGETVTVSFFADDAKPGVALASGTYTQP